MSLEKDFISAITESTKSKTSGYKTSATVVRKDGDTVYVHIPGGVDETPASTGISASEGDTVYLEVENGKARIYGNVTSPATDDTVANVAQVTATTAQATAETASEDAVIAKNAAESATSSATTAYNQAVSATTSATNAGIAAANAQAAAEAAQADFTSHKSYFWHDDEGAHVLSEEIGKRLDMKSDGLHILSLTDSSELAQFTSDKAVIGKESDAHATITSGGMVVIDEDGEEIAHLGHGSVRNLNGNIVQGNWTTLGTRGTETAGKNSVAEGTNTNASGANSHSEGTDTTASGSNSHAEGSNTSATSDHCHAEGYFSGANGQCSHAEGTSRADGEVSHAEGNGTLASGKFSHSEGDSTNATGDYSHAEGQETTASGIVSHAEGYYTTASGSYSHAEGSFTKASSGFQHVEGKYNVEDTEGVYAHIIGNGASNSARSNALTVDWDGNLEVAGNVTPQEISGIANLIYPVGSIYMSVNNTSPATLFGGTWERIQDTFLLAAGSTYTAGATGGEAEHTLTTDEMPSHTHAVYRSLNAASGSARYSSIQATSGTVNTITSQSAGGGSAHNNMPPYLAVYAWKRTA